MSERSKFHEVFLLSRRKVEGKSSQKSCKHSLILNLARANLLFTVPSGFLVALRYFHVIHLLDICQDDYCSEIHWKIIQTMLNGMFKLLRFRFFFQRRIRVSNPYGDSISSPSMEIGSRGTVGRRFFFPEDVIAGIGYSSQQPGSKRTSPERIDVRISRNKCILRCIRC